MAAKTAVITGATGLLGRQVMKEFRLRNWTVKGTGLSRADGVETLKVDLTNEDDIEVMLDEVRSVPSIPARHCG